MNELLKRTVGAVAFALVMSAGAQTPDPSSNTSGESNPDTTKTEPGADAKSHRSDDVDAAKDGPATKDSGDDGMGEMHREGRMDQDGASGAVSAPPSTTPGDR